MSFCSNCGAEMKEGQAICLSCGFALKGNAVPVEEVVEKDYSNRVKHDVLKLLPDFESGPVGRMDYFKSFLIIFAIAMAASAILGITMASVQGNPAVAPVMIVFAFVAMALFLILFVHQIALNYKRFWDMGFEDKGTRVGLTIGYYLVSMVPVLNLAIFAMFFIPGKGKQ